MRHTSTILTCLGGIGVVATSIMSIKATPKALELIEEAKKDKGEELSKWETVKVAAPKYIPAMITGIATIACVLGANVLNKRQQASLISAYALIDESYKKYRRKVIEKYGEEAHEEIMNEITVEETKEVYIHANNLGTDCTQFLEEDYSKPVLFYDEYGKRYFEAPIEQVITAQYHINRNLVLRGYVTLNELYDFLGLEPTDYGNTVGWTIEDDFCWIDFNQHKVLIDDNIECYIIETPWGPSANFLEYY